MRRLAVLFLGFAIAALTAFPAAAGQASPPSPSVSGGPGKHKAMLAWKAPPPDPKSTVDHYDIYRGSASIKKGQVKCPKKLKKIASTAGPTTQYTDETVSAGKAYCYAVTAVGSRGESSQSFWATAIIPKP